MEMKTGKEMLSRTPTHEGDEVALVEQLAKALYDTDPEYGNRSVWVEFEEQPEQTKTRFRARATEMLPVIREGGRAALVDRLVERWGADPSLQAGVPYRRMASEAAEEASLFETLLARLAARHNALLGRLADALQPYASGAVGDVEMTDAVTRIVAELAALRRHIEEASDAQEAPSGHVASVAALRERIDELEQEKKDLALRAFVKGAKWWEFEKEGATMWPSDQRKAAAEAERRYPFPLSPSEAAS